MSNVTYTLVEKPGDSNISVFVDGQMFVTTSEHPRWAEILDAVRTDAEVDYEALFDVSVKVAQKFEKVSDRVALAGGRVYFDGDEVDNALTQQIVRFMEEGVEDFKPLVNFFEKIAQNPEQHSREQAYAWLSRHKFTITEDGNILMYKGVKVDANGDYRSIHAGPGIVNGEADNGYLRNNVGDVVEIARSRVEFNPGVGCAAGLHAGTYAYASGFAQGALLTVEVHPRDIVSVPTDCDAQKVRVSRYTVKEVTPHEYTSPLYTATTAFSTYDADGSDACLDCGDEGDWSDTEGYCGICY